MGNCSVLLHFQILFVFILITTQAKRYQPGIPFELQCPKIQLNQISNARVFVLILNNAQKNMQITISSAQSQSLSSQSDSSSLPPLCTLNKNSKICVLSSSFSPLSTLSTLSSLSITCTSSGSITLLLLEPTIFTSIPETQPIRQQIIALDMEDEERGVVVFNVDQHEGEGEENGWGREGDEGKKEFFIENCVESVEFFGRELYAGVVGKTGRVCVVMVNEGVTGQWTFAKTQTTLTPNHPVQSFSLPNQTLSFPLSQSSPTSHSIHILLRTENRQLLSSLTLSLTFSFLVTDSLAIEHKQVEKTIKIEPNELEGKLPIKIYVYFQQHPIKNIKIMCSKYLHYVLEMGDDEKNRPILQEDQYLIYLYQNIRHENINVQAHISKFYRSKQTALLRILSTKIRSITGIVKNYHQKYFQLLNQTLNSTASQNPEMQIISNKILPIKLDDSNPYAQFELQIEPQQQKNSPKSEIKYFRLMLQTSYIPIQIQLNKKTKQYIFQNEIKRFILSKPKLQQLLQQSHQHTQTQLDQQPQKQSPPSASSFPSVQPQQSQAQAQSQLQLPKKLQIMCKNCHAFLTYNFSCTEINCCQYAHVDQIQVKNASLMIIVKGIQHYSVGEQVKEIQLVVKESEMEMILADGEIVQGLLTNTETFIFAYDGREDVEIIFDSKIQSILLLASLTSFPDKKSFDHQSNEGYLKIPAPKPKTKRTIYIRIIKMFTSFSNFQVGQKIPYSIVTVTESGRIKLMEGKLFKQFLGKKMQREYGIEHAGLGGLADGGERVYLRIHARKYFGNNGKNGVNSALLKVQFKLQNTQKWIFGRQIRQSATIDLTKYFTQTKKTQSSSSSSSSSPSSQSPHSLSVLLTNIQPSSSQSLHISLIFFKQKQIYQINCGQFIQDRILVGNQIILYGVIDPMKEINVYAYSVDERMEMGVQIVSIGSKELGHFGEFYQYDRKEKQRQRLSLGRNAKSHKKLITLMQQSSKIPSHSQYLFFSQLNSKSPNLTVAIISLKYFSLKNSNPSVSPFSSQYPSRNSNSTVSSTQNPPRQQSQQQIFKLKDISVICTQGDTLLKTGNKVRYRLGRGKTHRFFFPLAMDTIGIGDQDGIGEAKENMERERKKRGYKEIILQTAKIQGNYQIKAILKYNGQAIGNLSINQNTKRQRQSTTTSKPSIKSEQISIIKTLQIKQKFLQHLQTINSFSSSSSTSSSKNSHNLLVQFELTCLAISSSSFSTTSASQSQSYCQFVTSLQTSNSSIRQLVTGIPELFYLNKHSSIIFVYDNQLYDKQFKFKINRKYGFPKYKICSSRTPTSSSNVGQEPPLSQCLRQLQFEQQQQLDINLRFNSNMNINYKSKSKQNSQYSQQQPYSQYIEQNTISGHTHQLIINYKSQHYCTNCKYYLALFADYEVVEGSVFVMVNGYGTMLEEGNSITTIVYRNGNGELERQADRGNGDCYILANWGKLMGVLYPIQGNAFVQVYTYIHNTTNTTPTKQILLSSPTSPHTPFPINISSSSTFAPSSSPQLYIQIHPSINLPSCLYTLIIVNKQQQIINIKDGVPYEMKYGKWIGNPVVRYRYVCENQGVATIGTRNFGDLKIQMQCLDTDTQSSTISEQMTIPDDEIPSSPAPTPSFRSLPLPSTPQPLTTSLPIPLSPKQCTHYQFTLTPLSPTLSYSMLISSTDIITLPLFHQMPSTLRNPSKLYQIYQIIIQQKCFLKIKFKFCQGGDGKIMIANQKRKIDDEEYEEEIQVYEGTGFEGIGYKAKPGFLYLKVEFKGRGRIMEYTVYVEVQGGNGARGRDKGELGIYGGIDQIMYRVVRIAENYTQYQIRFYQIVENDGSLPQQLEIQYFIVESTKLRLLKKIQNCNGQYFTQFINHHDQIFQTKIDLQQARQKGRQYYLENIEQQTLSQQQLLYCLDSSSQSPSASSRHTPPLLVVSYKTSTPYPFLTIIPTIHSSSSSSSPSSFYHSYIPKYSQIQLQNGQLFTHITYIINEILIWGQKFFNINVYGNGGTSRGGAGTRKGMNLSREEIVILVMIGMGLCVIGVGCVGIGVFIGRRYWMKTVYVLREIRQEEGEEGDVEDNAIGENSVQMFGNIQVQPNQEPVRQQLRQQSSNQIIRQPLAQQNQIENVT